MITVWTGWRLAKFAALFVLVGATTGVLCRPSRTDRLRLAYQGVLPAFVAIWTSGFGLMHSTARGFEGWILAAMGASLVSLHLVLLAAHRPRPRAMTGALATGGLAVALTEMVVRPSVPLLHAVALAMGVLATVAGTGLPPPADDRNPEADALALRAVVWSGRVEGASLLLLLAVSIGRRVLGVDVGWATSLLGWIHGVIVLVWLQVLVVGGRSLGWTVPSLLFGVVTFLPFGSVVYERFGPVRKNT